MLTDNGHVTPTVPLPSQFRPLKCSFFLSLSLCSVGGGGVNKVHYGLCESSQWEWLRTLYEMSHKVPNIKIRVQHCNDEIISNSDK